VKPRSKSAKRFLLLIPAFVLAVFGGILLFVAFPGVIEWKQTGNLPQDLGLLLVTIAVCAYVVAILINAGIRRE
jgi:hypothetical protein